MTPTTAAAGGASAAAPVDEQDPSSRQLSYDDLLDRRANHPAWRLLMADHGPFVLGFLSQTFLEPNVRSLPQPQIVDALEDCLLARRADTPDAFPKSAEAYLSDWSDSKAGWLRRSYPPGSDIPVYEPTAAVETAAKFCRDLARRSFVGTESRLLTIRDLLRQITVGASTDPAARLAALEAQRADIDAAIARIHRGEDTAMDEVAIKERYELVVDTGRALLGDLRQVEDNFRALDRTVRARATSWTGTRGQFLEQVFGTKGAIDDSAQGRSFAAFWTHLLSASQRIELIGMLSAVGELPVLAGRTGEIEQLLNQELFTAAKSTQLTMASLSKQLRSFLDDASWSETRRINLLLRETLAAALELSRNSPDEAAGVGAEVPALRAEVGLPLERPPFTPKFTGKLDSTPIQDADDTDVDISELLDQFTVDLDVLRTHVRSQLLTRGGFVTLAEVVAVHPLEHGLAELLGYLQISGEDEPDVLTQVTDDREHVELVDEDGRRRRADIPQVLFTARGALAGAHASRGAASTTAAPASTAPPVSGPHPDLREDQ